MLGLGKWCIPPCIPLKSQQAYNDTRNGTIKFLVRNRIYCWVPTIPVLIDAQYRCYPDGAYIVAFMVKNPFAQQIWSGHQSMRKLLSFYFRCSQLESKEATTQTTLRTICFDSDWNSHVLLPYDSVKNLGTTYQMRSNQILPLSCLRVSLAYPRCPRSCSGAQSIRSAFSCLDRSCQQQIQTSAAHSEYAAAWFNTLLD